MNEQHIAVEEFYEACGQLLGCPHEFIVPIGRKTRWNNRHAGNGRYPGFGTIRMFGHNAIQVSLREPVRISRLFKSKESVFEVLRSIRPEIESHLRYLENLHKKAEALDAIENPTVEDVREYFEAFK